MLPQTGLEWWSDHRGLLCRWYFSHTWQSLKPHLDLCSWTVKRQQLPGPSNCPCASPYPGSAAPPFVGENFFCESGNTGPWESQWYLDDPLWDSQGCASGSTCCDHGGPWFTTTLLEATIDDIEVRWCTSYDTEDIAVEQLEIYIN